MKITVYTITDCQYSKQEKDYLTANNLQYEEKGLETNKEFLTEMLAISNNFAGTPVTRVEKDDGSIVVLKGFTKGEFDTTFGFAEAKPTEPSSAKATAGEPTAENTQATPPPAPVAETPSVPLSGTPADKAKSDELNSVLDKLEDKTAPAPTAAPPVEPTPPTNSTNSTNPPSVPDFPDAVKTTV